MDYRSLFPAAATERVAQASGEWASQRHLWAQIPDLAVPEQKMYNTWNNLIIATMKQVDGMAS